MKLILMLVACFFLTGSVFAADKPELKTQKDRLSYALGQTTGKSFKKNNIDLDLNFFLEGLKDAMTGAEPRLSDAEINAAIMSAQKNIQVKQQEQKKTIGGKNKKEGAIFLAANKNKIGVITLPSGLQYKILHEGTGRTPKITDTVSVQYKGSLIDGTEFDSSYKRGQAATFPVHGVIKGWTEALQLMKEGSKWQLVIPADLAYGERGTPGGPIGPNAVLIFEVELLSVK